jgi:methionyl-tRNA formyltransferase
MKFIIFTKKKWDLKNYKGLKNFIIMDKLNYQKIKQINPKIIFFIHWSKIIKNSLFENYLCIQFHCSALPKGRGGSPVQNQILQGIKKTKLTAFKMSKKIDSGPICMQENFLLNGTAFEIFKRLEKLSIKMIKKIVKKKKLVFRNQIGLPTYFKRRSKADSQIDFKKFNTLTKLYNFLRMLDGPGYPNAFFEKNNFIYNFSNIKLRKNEIYSNVVIKKK